MTIPQPCHESWAAMTPTAQGRHCAACHKTVVDFTALSDPEILAFLQKSGSSELCGRVMDAQLNRPLQPLGLAPARRWQAWLATLATVLGLRGLLASGAQAQQAPTEQAARRAIGIRHYKTLPEAGKELAAGQADTTAALPPGAVNLSAADPLLMHTIRGRVVDAASGRALAGAVVGPEGSSAATFTDEEGRFMLWVPAVELKTTLRIRYLSYPEARREVLPEPAGGELLVEMSAPGPLSQPEVLAALSGRMGGVSIIGIRVQSQPAAPWFRGSLLSDWLR